jgi:CRISPR-associated protein Csb2
MNLSLEIEYLAGVAFAAQGPDTGVPDWPPQPDRVFSALVATWGARGEQDVEADALKWLEKQAVPIVTASQAAARTAPLSYVPPNDPKTGRSGDPTVLPVYRRRQPRRFPASRPHDTVVRFYWEGATPDETTFEALNCLASNTAYVGHSTSLTRCRFLRFEELPTAEARSPMRRIYVGRFDELRREYKRFVNSNGKVGRPHPGDRVNPTRAAADDTPHSYFSPEWLVLEHTEGEMPDIRAAALLAKEIRDTLLSGYQQCGMGDRIPSVVSGHMANGSPVQAPHLSIVPLAFAGYPYADGHVLGFALVPPGNSGLFEQGDFLQVMRRIAPHIREHERRELQLRHFELGLSPTLTPSRRSLDFAAYTRKATTFATVTPIVLDRHLKKSGSERQNEIVGQIRAGCRNIGLPEPSVVVPDKHSAIEGVPSALPSGKSPEWMRWRLPSSLASRLLTHAVIQFPCFVKGPVILGAGRFVGLGLCRPIDDLEDRS